MRRRPVKKPSGSRQMYVPLAGDGFGGSVRHPLTVAGDSVMRRTFALVLTLALVPAVLVAQKQCKKGIPCGGTCIAADKTCHVGGGGSYSAPGPSAKPPKAQRSDFSHLEPTVVAPAEDPPVVYAVTFVGSVADSIYFIATCSAAQDLHPTNIRRFLTQEDARKAGYKRSRVSDC